MFQRFFPLKKEVELLWFGAVSIKEERGRRRGGYAGSREGMEINNENIK